VRRWHNYTDFYTSIHHARNVGRIDPARRAADPNFQWLPIAYHGRASSVVVSGTPSTAPWARPCRRAPAAPVYGPCARLDFELEMGIYVGPRQCAGRAAVPLAQAEEHIFGMGLLNDWSARDHQFWEMAPLGPFLGKNFCTSVSPWVVTMEALAPFRVPPSAAPPIRSRWPIWTQPPTARWRRRRAADGGPGEAQHRAQGLPPAEISAPAFATSTGPWRRCSRSTPWAAATCKAATCWAPAPSRAPRPRKPAPWSS
jgi:fumarylacetoacetase